VQWGQYKNEQGSIFLSAAQVKLVSSLLWGTCLVVLGNFDAAFKNKNNKGFWMFPCIAKSWPRKKQCQNSQIYLKTTLLCNKSTYSLTFGWRSLCTDLALVLCTKWPRYFLSGLNHLCRAQVTSWKVDNFMVTNPKNRQ